MVLEGKIKGYITISKIDGDGNLFVRIDSDLKDDDENINLIEFDASSLKITKPSNKIVKGIFLAIDKNLQIKSDETIKNNLSFFANRHCEIRLNIDDLSIVTKDSKIELSISGLKENGSAFSIKSIEIID